MPSAGAAPKLWSGFGRLPLSFEANRGQTDPRVQYLTRGSGYAFHLRPTGAEMVLSHPETAPRKTAASQPVKPYPPALRASLLNMQILGSNPAAPALAEKPLAGKVHYLMGKDPKKWRTGVPTYRRVRYVGVYPGIDLVYYGNGRQLEYDFIVAPGVDPDRIVLRFQGQKRMRLNRRGDLILRMNGGEVRLKKPALYQTAGNRRERISGRYLPGERGTVRFHVGPYDRSRPLVIDPVLVYSTYFGGSFQDIPTSMAVDGGGSVYITGSTNSVDFPKKNPYQGTKGNSGTDFEGLDAFVVKLNPAGTELVYATYLGGAKRDQASGIAVDSSGNVYVAGVTESDNFPVANAFQPQRTSSPFSLTSDGFITALDASGTAPLYSSYLGGSSNDSVMGIALDKDRNAYLTGTSDSFDFPVVKSANNTSVAGKAFLAKVSPPGADAPASIAYSFVQGSNTFESAQTIGMRVAVDGSGNAFMTGTTTAKNFSTANTTSITHAGSDDTFVTMVAPPSGPPGQEKVSVVYSTLLGGKGQEIPRGIGLDGAGNAYVAGFTTSDDLAVTNAAYQKTYGGGFGDVFAAKFVTPTNGGFVSLNYATYLGKGGSDAGNGIAVTPEGKAYVVGSTTSTDFLTLSPLQGSNKGSQDLILTRLDSLGFPEFSTYLGGSSNDDGVALALGGSGEVYVAGRTLSEDYPRTGTPINPMDFEGQAFVSKINVDLETSFNVLGVFPSRAGDKGDCSVILKGQGFKDGATVKLMRAGQTEIPGKFPGVGGEGTRLAATFDLTQRALGPWDVVISNPDGNVFTLSGGFTVEPAKESQVWVDLIGPRFARIGRPTTYTIFYGNRGNTNAVAIPVWITGIPKDALVTHDALASTHIRPGDDTDYSQIPDVGETPDGKFMLLMSMLIPPGSTGYFRFTITTQSTATFTLNTWAGPSIFDPAAPNGGFGPLQSPPSTTPEQDCIKVAMDQLLKYAIKKVIERAVPADCINESIKAVQTVISESLNAIQAGNNGTFTDAQALGSLTKIIIGGLKAGIKCAAAAAEIAVPEAKFILLAYDVIGIIPDLYKLLDKCKDIFKPQNPKSHRTQIVNSADPNDKYGSEGVGDGHFISPQEPLRYAVQFENKPEATAPAQDVVITDQLDKEKVDLSAFFLGPIRFGSKVVIPDPYSSTYATDVDLRPSKNLIVRVTAGVDLNTGIATWTFRSLDPETKQPPEDPLAGFLPPNKTSPEGEGAVLFTVSPKTGLATGTEIRNKASIVFDTNAPILTPEWLNTLDLSLPTSAVKPVADLSLSRFPVSWAGTDEGSGVDHYVVYVSEGGGAFIPWLLHTTETSGWFTGSPGKSYAFYSLSEDRTGNREEGKTAGDVTVAVPAEAFLTGDANLDKQVNVGDAVLVLQAAVGSATLSETARKAADVNLDVQVNVQDAVDILRKTVGLPTSF